MDIVIIDPLLIMTNVTIVLDHLWEGTFSEKPLWLIGYAIINIGHVSGISMASENNSLSLKLKWDKSSEVMKMWHEVFMTMTKVTWSIYDYEKREIKLFS